MMEATLSELYLELSLSLFLSLSWADRADKQSAPAHMPV